jgi:7-carboxy-7-deazaguanine synthase
MKIKLNPITKQKYEISEIFYSIQGEGPQIGMPAVFIRMSRCNLRCPWCDSKYSLVGGVHMKMQEILDDVDSFKCPNVVITGGEPMLQPLYDLVVELTNRECNIFIETNGSIYDEDLLKLATFIVSPKITTGITYKAKVAEEYRNNLKKWSRHSTFKFVVDTKDDLDEIVQFCSEVQPIYPIYLMPQAINEEAMRNKLLWLIDEVKTDYSDFRVTPRLHIWLYGNKRGV